MKLIMFHDTTMTLSLPPFLSLAAIDIRPLPDITNSNHEEEEGYTERAELVVNKRNVTRKFKTHTQL